MPCVALAVLVHYDNSVRKVCSFQELAHITIYSIAKPLCANSRVSVFDHIIPALVCVQLLWTFSIYLEAVAILPQIFVLHYTKKIENLTAHYMYIIYLLR